MVGALESVDGTLEDDAVGRDLVLLKRFVAGISVLARQQHATPVKAGCDKILVA